MKVQSREWWQRQSESEEGKGRGGTQGETVPWYRVLRTAFMGTRCLVVLWCCHLASSLSSQHQILIDLPFSVVCQEK